MKFIHASDFHLCSSFHQSSLPSEVAATHRDQLWQTFYRIVETCRKDQIDLLLISGDLYEHEYAKLSDVKRIADAFDTIPHTKILIACGNHDPLYERSYYKVLEFPQNVFIFPSEYTCLELEELNTIVYGFSWNRTRYDSIPFTFDQQKKAKTNILLLHCDVINKSQYMPVDQSDLTKLPFDYIALGHIHKSMQVRNQMFYSGSPEPLDFGEEGKHGYFVGEMLEDKMTVKFVKCAKRSFFSISITLDGSMNNNNIKEAVRAACADLPLQNIYRVLFEGTLSHQINLEVLMNELRSDYYCLLWENHTVPDYDIGLLYEQNRDNMIGKYIEAFQNKTADPVAEKALRYGLGALLEQNGGLS